MEAVNGAPLKDNAAYITTNVGYTNDLTAAGAEVPFNFGAVTFDKPGTYVYNITENIPTEGKIPSVSYDSSSYSVTVTITDNGSGQLEMTDHTITKDGETENGETKAKFVNTYSATAVNVTLKATKELNVVVGNRTLKANEFSFELLDKTGETVNTTTNDADGNVKFDLNFTEADSFLHLHQLQLCQQ